MPRYQAIGLQTTGVLAICAGVYALGILVGYQPRVTMRPLETAVWFLCGSGAFYLFSSGAFQLTLGRSAFGPAPASRRALWVFFAMEVTVLAVLLFVMFRGPTGRVYLAGLDILLAVLVSVAGLATLLTFPEPWRNGNRDVTGLEQTAPSRRHWALWSWHAVSSALLLAALGYLEIQPIPGA